MTIVKAPVAVICTFLWIGFVSAISFMEAWLKFRAPGITLPLGLGIGRIVFAALNKVEWIFAIAIILQLIFSKKLTNTWKSLFIWTAVLVLIIQSIWLLPSLDARAQLYVDGASVSPSNLHIYFIILEIIKVSCLFLFGISLFNKYKNI